jgi:hypothetical protein
VDVEGGVCLFGCRIEDGCDFLGEGWDCLGAPSNPDGEEVMVCTGLP